MKAYGRIMLQRVPTNFDIFDNITERTMSNIFFFFKCLLIKGCIFHTVNFKMYIANIDRITRKNWQSHTQWDILNNSKNGFCTTVALSTHSMCSVHHTCISPSPPHSFCGMCKGRHMVSLKEARADCAGGDSVGIEHR